MTLVSTSPDSALIRSALNWWTLAGVDQLIDEEPLGWLTRGKTVAPSQREDAPVPLTVPKTHEALVAYLNTADSLSEAGPVARRITASGNPQADLAVVIDMPELNDHQAGYLISGDAGELFEKMLSALGLARSDCYVLAICPGRPAGGVLAESALAQLGGLARDHIAMTGASRLWLMGQTVSRAILAMDFAQARGSLQNFNHNGQIKKAVVSFSPRMLLQSPGRKRAAWDDMQMLMAKDETEA